MRDFDQFERRFVHVFFEFAVAFPVAVGFFHHDAAFEQQALQHLADVEAVVMGLAHAERDVFKVAEQCHITGVAGGDHARSLFSLRALCGRQRKKSMDLCVNGCVKPSINATIAK